MVRQIRDRQTEELAGKSEAEVIEYFRRAGERARTEARQWAGGHHSARLGA
jgi:hypothetical protein